MATYDSAEAIRDIPGASYESLRSRFKALAIVVDAVSAERCALNEEMKRREKEAVIGVRLQALGPDGKEVLRSVLEVQ